MDNEESIGGIQSRVSVIEVEVFEVDLFTYV